MADAKKILILYASAGHGHKKAAEAVLDSLRRRSSELGVSDISCLDILAMTRFGFGPRYRALYLFMISAVPWLWGFSYYFADIRFIYPLMGAIRRVNNHFFASPLEKHIIEAKADIIVSTHFLSTETAGHLKKKGFIQSKLVTVVTDYLPHMFWLSAQNDLYCVGSEETARDLESRGVPAQKIRVTGIPIEAKFSNAPSREASRAKLGLNKSLFTVLLTSGGAGVVLLEPVVDKLAFQEPPIQLLVVCGTNEKMKQRLFARHRDRANVRLFGFVDNIQELMSASDLIVGKGGGLTITESLAMARPMILIGAVPGQETRNVRVMVRKGAASRADAFLQVANLIHKYRSDAAFYGKTLSVIEATRRPKAADAVVDAALGLS